MNIRPSTPNQHFACRTINTLTGIPLPENYAINFHACHAYIGMYYNNAKYIRDTHPIQRSDWREPPQPQPYEPGNYSRLHEAIANAIADPLRRDDNAPPYASQRAAIMFIREQLGVIPPPDVIRYRANAAEFINEHYANARAYHALHGREGSPPPLPDGANQSPSLDAYEFMAQVSMADRAHAEMRRRMNFLDNPAIMRTLSRADMEQILANGPEPMPTGLSYEGPSPSDPERVTIRRWPDNHTAPQPRPLTEGDLISSTLQWYSQDEPEPEPDDAPSEETLKDLIARQFHKQEESV